MRVVEVVRVPCLPSSGAVLVEDEPTHRAVWLLECHITEAGARALEALLNKDERFFDAFARLIAARPCRPPIPPDGLPWDHGRG